MIALQSWQSFFEMIGGAAATLLGLLFVSASVNATAMLSDAHRHSRRLAEQAFQNYLAILMISLGAVIPRTSLAGFAYFILGTVALWAMWVVIRVASTIVDPAEGASRLRLARRYLTSLVGFGLLLYAGYDMAIRHGSDLDFVCIGLILLLASATIVSWDLLLSIAGTKAAGGNKSL